MGNGWANVRARAPDAKAFDRPQAYNYYLSWN